MVGWSRSLEVYLVKPIEGRLKLLRTRGKYWKAVAELRGKRTYLKSVPAEIVEKPAKQIILYLAEKCGVEIKYYESRRAKRTIGKKAHIKNTEPPVKLVEDVIVEWKRYSVKGDIWLLHVRKGLNRWVLCLTQLSGGKKFNIKYVNIKEREHILYLKNYEGESELLRHLEKQFNIKIYYPESHKTWEDEKLDAIESGDREKLLELYMENPQIFTQDEIEEYELEEMKQEWEEY